jgi:uncharacterized membrane protein
MTRDRLEAFSDGVFAVAATLLVLNIKLAESDVSSNSQLNVVLRESVPNMLIFIFTFLVVGVFWVGHQRIYARVKNVSHFLLWSNIVYLLTIAVIPFPAAVLAKHPFFITSIIFYSIVMFLSGIQHVTVLIYLKRHPYLMDKPPTEKAYRKMLAIAIIGPACYLLAALTSFLYTPAGFIFLILALVFYIFLLPHFSKEEPASA